MMQLQHLATLTTEEGEEFIFRVSVGNARLRLRTGSDPYIEAVIEVDYNGRDKCIEAARKARLVGFGRRVWLRVPSVSGAATFLARIRRTKGAVASPLVVTITMPLGTRLKLGASGEFPH